MTPASRSGSRDSRLREATQEGFGFLEDILYVAVALALVGAGAILFGSAVYSFITHVTDGEMNSLILELLDGLLLVFIVTELIHTVRVVLDEKVLVSEPFLVVGIVAIIRRLVVVSAEAKNLFGSATFADAMLEIGVLTAAALALGATIFMLRHTKQSEPKPGHEPD
jgi:uncharacterized membrane protein (DUF373 family)